MLGVISIGACTKQPAFTCALFVLLYVARVQAGSPPSMGTWRRVAMAVAACDPPKTLRIDTVSYSDVIPTPASLAPLIPARAKRTIPKINPTIVHCNDHYYQTFDETILF